MISSVSCASPLGGMLLAADGGALVGAWFFGQRFFAEPFAGTLVPGDADAPVFASARAWLDAYFRGENPPASALPPLAPRGTPFRLAVWRALRDVPFGETRAYGEIARALGLGASAARAVGGAVARNPLSVFVPCHRVVGADGSATGYAGGLPRKRALLALESRAAKAFPPKIGLSPGAPAA